MNTDELKNNVVELASKNRSSRARYPDFTTLESAHYPSPHVILFPVENLWNYKCIGRRRDSP
jgi:hypothetical protein